METSPSMSTPPAPSQPGHFWTYLLIIIITAVISVGATYWYLTARADKEQTSGSVPVATSTTTPTPTPTPTTTTSTTAASPASAPASSNTIVDLSSAKVGDVAGTMTIVSIQPFSATTTPPKNDPLSTTNARVVFSGQATVAGTYTYELSDLTGSYDLSFAVNAATIDKLPRLKNDDRAGQVTADFSNQADAMSKLGITSNVAKKGTATITIKDFVMNRYPAEVRDTFALVSVN